MKSGESVDRIGVGVEAVCPRNPLSAEAPASLSSQLKIRTAPLHKEIEVLLGLPEVIRTCSDYVVWLTHFLGFYEPLERKLSVFSDRSSNFLAPGKRMHSARIVDDLSVLGTNADEVARASSAQLPDLSSFAHVLGAHYVLEGASLGGRVILRDVLARIGEPIAQATSFFGGGIEAVGPTWKHFQTTLDDFGRKQPQQVEDVVTGAKRTFCTMLTWFALHCSTGGGRP